MSRVRIFLSGPYTSSPTANTLKAMAVAARLKVHGIECYTPHLSHFIHELYPFSYEEWMATALTFLPCCHAVLRLPGESPGADRECAEAERRGIPIWTDEAALVAAVGA